MWYAMAYSIYKDGDTQDDLTSWVPSNIRVTYGTSQSSDSSHLVYLFYENTSDSEK